MKFSLLAIVLIACSLSSFAQNPILTGTIRDAENKQPLAGATVKILLGKDSVTVLSDKAGSFEFKNLADSGIYNLTITFLGYEVIKRDIVWSNVTKKLDDILINKEAKTLGGVTVVSTPPVVKQKAD